MTKLSKAARIRALYAKGKSTTQIAGTVGCSVTYARVCARQRILESGRSVFDVAYSPGYQKRRYHTDKAYRKKHLAVMSKYKANLRKTDPEWRARDIARCAAYRARKRAERMEAHP